MMCRKNSYSRFVWFDVVNNVNHNTILIFWCYSFQSYNYHGCSNLTNQIAQTEVDNHIQVIYIDIIPLVPGLETTRATPYMQ